MDKLSLSFEDKLYYLDEGDTLGFYCDQEKYDKYVVYNGDEYHLSTFNWFGDKKNGKCPIKFSYINGKLNIEIFEWAYNIIGINSCVLRSGNYMNYDINNDNFQIKISESDDFVNGITIQVDVVDSQSIENNIDKNKLKTYNNDKYNNPDETKEIDYILTKELDAEVIGTGSDRTAYDISDINPEFLQNNDGDIIKVAKDNESNRSEARAYQVIKGTELERFVCPITNIGPNHKYIVMEKAEMSADNIQNSVKKYDAIPSNLENPSEILTEIMMTAIIDPHGRVGDIRDSNIGYYDGDPVVLDYQFGGSIYVDSSRLYKSKSSDKNNIYKNLRDDTSRFS